MKPVGLTPPWRCSYHGNHESALLLVNGTGIVVYNVCFEVELRAKVKLHLLESVRSEKYKQH